MVVLLHAGVADRRSWRPLSTPLGARLTAVSYDRRGFGDTGPATSPFSHLEDLAAVLEQPAVVAELLVEAITSPSGHGRS